MLSVRVVPSITTIDVSKCTDNSIGYILFVVTVCVIHRVCRIMSYLLDLNRLTEVHCRTTAAVNSRGRTGKGSGLL